jgi:hypothetical protein
MRITRSQGEHLVVLSDVEASALVDASALLVVTAKMTPNAALPPEMVKVLRQLFEGLKPTAIVTCAPDQNH